MTVEEVAILLDVHEETVRRWIRKGKLKAEKVGLTYVIEESSIKEKKKIIEPLRTEKNNVLNFLKKTENELFSLKTSLDEQFENGMSANTVNSNREILDALSKLSSTVQFNISLKERLKELKENE